MDEALQRSTVTQGIPRMRELIDASQNPKTPCCYVALSAGVSRDLATKMAATLPETYLKDVIDACTVDRWDTCVETRETDALLLESHEVCIQAGLVEPLQNASRFVIRLVLSAAKLQEIHMTVKTVALAITRQYPNAAYMEILAAEDHMPEPVIRIRMRRVPDQDPNDLHLERNMAHLFMKHLSNGVFLTGLRGVKLAHVTTVKQSVFSADTDVRDEDEYQLQVMGTNLTTLWDLELCDWSRTWTNNVQVVAEVLGIEAAAQQLFHEISAVLAIDSSYVSERHVSDPINGMGQRSKRVVF